MASVQSTSRPDILSSEFLVVELCKNIQLFPKENFAVYLSTLVFRSQELLFMGKGLIMVTRQERL